MSHDLCPTTLTLSILPVVLNVVPKSSCGKEEILSVCSRLLYFGCFSRSSGPSVEARDTPAGRRSNAIKPRQDSPQTLLQVLQMKVFFFRATIVTVAA